MANSLNEGTLPRHGADHETGRACDWPGCDGEGLHRAPRSRTELSCYHWFCLAHARAYNAGWNYYVGMSDTEVEFDIRRDTVWHRPSWPLGAGPGGGNGRPFPDALLDQLGAFGPDWTTGAGFSKRPEPNARPGTRQAWAVAVFALSGPVTLLAVKTRYKELVKRHHPDANGGAKTDEEKIKEINEAYKIILDMIET